MSDDKWYGTDLVDMRKNEFVVGDMVVKPEMSGQSASLRIGIVTKIENGKMYLDNSKVAIRYPSRMLIVTKLFVEKE